MMKKKSQDKKTKKKYLLKEIEGIKKRIKKIEKKIKSWVALQKADRKSDNHQIAKSDKKKDKSIKQTGPSGTDPGNSKKQGDHSSKYDVKQAVLKLRSLSHAEEIINFTRGDTRLMIKKAIPGALKKLKR